MLFKLLLSLLGVMRVFSGVIDEPNTCQETVSFEKNNYTLEYRLCKFDTLLTAMKNDTDWLFIGMQCDDRCPTNSVAEGYLCSERIDGYFEIEDNKFDERINKIEFHHFKCQVSDNGVYLHAHRFMPNAWIKNMSIPYYVASGSNDKMILENITEFTIDY